MENKNSIREQYIVCSQKEYQAFMDDAGERIIQTVLWQYKITGKEKPDVYQEACLATAHALACYDSARLDVKLSTYVWYCVENIAKMYIRAQQAEKRAAEKDVISYEDVLTQEFSATEENQPIANYKPTAVWDDYFHNPAAAKELLGKMMQEAALTKTHKSIIELMLKGLPQSAIGAKLNMSQSKVSKMLSEAKELLRNTRAAQVAIA